MKVRYKILKVLVNLKRDEARTIEKIFGRLNSLHNLSVMLAADNNLFAEKSSMYEKIVNDYQKTQRLYDDWWQETVSKYNLQQYNVQKLSVNFRTQDIELLN